MCLLTLQQAETEFDGQQDSEKLYCIQIGSVSLQVLTLLSSDIASGDMTDHDQRKQGSSPDITEHAHNVRTKGFPREFMRQRRRRHSNDEGLSTFHDDRKIEDLELEAREYNTTNPLLLTFFGNIAALKVFVLYLVTLDTLIACALSVGLTLYWYFNYRDSTTWVGSGMDWALLGFAVVTPISASVSMAFSRREQALVRIAQIKSFSFQLYVAHSLWEMENGGRESHPDVDWLAHSDAVLAQLIGIGDELCRYLTLPTATRSRHRLTSHGRKEAALTLVVSYRLFDSLYTHRITRLSQYAERLRKLGLASGELSRIRQYERFLGEAIEGLRMFKHYRTPQALRSFARLFTLVLPPFYAPTFAQLAVDVRSLAVGIIFSVVTTLALTALFETIQMLEDPFVSFLTLDGIDVREELEVLHWHQLVQTRTILFPHATPYPLGTRNALHPQKDEELGELQGFDESSRLSSFALMELLNDNDSSAGGIRTTTTGTSFSTPRPRIYSNEQA